MLAWKRTWKNDDDDDDDENCLFKLWDKFIIYKQYNSCFITTALACDPTQHADLAAVVMQEGLYMSNYYLFHFFQF